MALTYRGILDDVALGNRDSSVISLICTLWSLTSSERLCTPQNGKRKETGNAQQMHFEGSLKIVRRLKLCLLDSKSHTGGMKLL